MKYKPFHIITFTVFFFSLAMLSKSVWFVTSNFILAAIFMMPSTYFEGKVNDKARRFSKDTTDRTSGYNFDIFDFKQKEIRKIPDKTVRKEYTLALLFTNLVKVNFALSGILIVLYNTVFGGR